MRLRILLGTDDSERGGIMEDSVQKPVVRTHTHSSANALPLDAIKEVIDERMEAPLHRSPLKVKMPLKYRISLVIIRPKLISRFPIH